MARQGPRAVVESGLARVPLPRSTAAALPPDAPALTVAAAVVKTFTKPRWLIVHLIAVAAAGGMVWLGIWQLDVSNERHFDLQNFGYAFQWWAFSAATLYVWFRLMRDTWRPKQVTEQAGVPLARLHQPGSAVIGPESPGSALLAAAATDSGELPTVYRGYVIPSSATNLVRSDGDGYQDSYNDYLWKLNQADERKTTRSRGPQAAEIVEHRPGELPPSP